MEKVNFRSLLKNRSFISLWTAQFLCQLADRMFTYALIFSSYHFMKSNLGSSLPMLTYGIPALLFSVAFGVLVDRYRKKKILFGSNICRAILVGIIVLTPHFSIDLTYLLYIFGISFILFSISQLFIPAELAAITHVVSKHELILANSLFTATWMLASIIGFGIAAPIKYYLGIDATYYFIIGLYILSALFIFITPIPEKVTRRKFKASTLLRELRSGVRFVLKHRIVFYAILQMGFSISLLAILSGISIGFVDKVLHKPESDFGYLVAVAGIGMVVGISFISQLYKKFKMLQIITLGFSLVGIMLICMSFTTELLASFACVFFMGIGNALISAPIQTIIQQRTPKLIQGRVFSIQNLVASFAFTLPPITAAFLADLFGHASVFFSLGIMAILFNFIIKKLEK